VQQTDLEEEKARELSKLQSSLEELQAKLDETSKMLAKEREAANTIEEACARETQSYRPKH
jgi:myosin V